MALTAPGHTDARGERPAVPAPVVTYALIAVNTLVFLLGPAAGLNPLYGTGQAQLCAEQRYEQRWGVIPAEVLAGRPLTAEQLAEAPEPAPGCPARPTPGKRPALSVLTGLFLHAGWLHLLGNLLFLYVFGPTVEQRLSRARYALFYLAAGSLATYGFALAEAHSADSTRVLIGASGAISAVLGAYLRFHPRSRVTTLVPLLLFLPLRFPAWLVLGLWFALQWWSVHSAGPGVAYLVHVIGFSAGFLYACTVVSHPPRRPG
ncbi:membrane associated rhomboid family serine protease [Kitasatospora sp. MAA19]|uniref:rhomboid family intramembrane serine protease n=1 Tax=Kitasatospora sp. MAA19 TaxID=3035090 RepID=UPI0024740B18|nr:rhomboid family intramembrane serine protease [Kitasatospora sp. MAA19]MDH6704293.1 membrane associated rhomboid family serine protease [Kitasatospora sp. MAA19]